MLKILFLSSALSRVYNFGPIFRAENSQTRQHASEFQMIEAEIAFLDNVEDLINVSLFYLFAIFMIIKRILCLTVEVKLHGILFYFRWWKDV